jgi:hypothetical protein
MQGAPDYRAVRRLLNNCLSRFGPKATKSGLDASSCLVTYHRHTPGRYLERLVVRFLFFKQLHTRTSFLEPPSRMAYQSQHQFQHIQFLQSAEIVNLQALISRS